MRTEALKTEKGFFIPMNDELENISRDRVSLDIEVIRPGGFREPETASRRPVGREDAGIHGRMRKASAIRLLEDWMADESGYDEEVWDTLKRTIEDNRLSGRRRFDE